MNSKILDDSVGTFNQNFGDCAFMASINTLSDNEVKSMIQKTNSGFTVTLLGNYTDKDGIIKQNGPFTVDLTYDEVYATNFNNNTSIYTKLSQGDLDAKIIEIALLKKYMELSGDEIEKEGLFIEPQIVYNMLHNNITLSDSLGAPLMINSFNRENIRNERKEHYMNMINNSSVPLIACTVADKIHRNLLYSDEELYAIKTYWSFTYGHTYTVLNCTNDVVILVNPYSNNVNLEMPWPVFLEKFYLNEVKA